MDDLRKACEVLALHHREHGVPLIHSRRLFELIDSRGASALAAVAALEARGVVEAYVDPFQEATCYRFDAAAAEALALEGEPQQASGKATKKRAVGRPRLSTKEAAKQQLAAEAVAAWRAWRKEKPSPKPDLEEWLLEHAPQEFDELGLDPQEVQKLATQHADNQRKRKQPAPRRRAR